MTDTQLPDAATTTDGWWPSRYGPDDQAGALNEITRELVRQAVGLVRRGQVYDLAHVLHALLLDLVDAGMHLVLGVLGLVGGLQVVDRHVGAVLGEAHRDRLSDTRASPGDQDVLALEPAQAPGPLGDR